MKYFLRLLSATVLFSIHIVFAQPPSIRGQQPTGPIFPTDDTVIKNIWAEAMDSSKLEMIAHELLDVVGPRLVGTPGMKRAHDWAVAKYKGWDIEAKNEEWGK